MKGKTGNVYVITVNIWLKCLRLFYFIVIQKYSVINFQQLFKFRFTLKLVENTVSLWKKTETFSSIEQAFKRKRGERFSEPVQNPLMQLRAQPDVVENNNN